MYTGKRSLWLIVLISAYLSASAQQMDSVAWYMQNYQYGKAIMLIDRTDPGGTDPELLYRKAGAYRGLNRFREAISCLEQVHRQDSTDIRCIIELADCYQSLANYPRTRHYYTMALQQDPGNPYLVRQLADSHFQERNYRKAKSQYLKAFAGDSGYYLSKQLARTYEGLGVADTAIVFYQRALALNPADYFSTYRLASLYKDQEQYLAGIMLTGSYLEGDTASIEMLKLNGFLHFLNKDYERSKARFEQCIALDDTSEFVNKYLGYSYFKTEEYDAAKDYLEKAWFRDTTNADLCYVLGLSCDYSFYKKLGIRYLEKTVDLMSPSPETLSRVYRDLGKAYTGYYQYAEALDAYLTAHELNPADTVLIFEIASHYDNWIKDKNKALEWYGKFMETRPVDRKSLPKLPTSEGITVSYYDFVERRINEIRKEIFWEGKETKEEIPRP